MKYLGIYVPRYFLQLNLDVFQLLSTLDLAVRPTYTPRPPETLIICELILISLLEIYIATLLQRLRGRQVKSSHSSHRPEQSTT